MAGFTEYLQSSLQGVFTNELFMGIVLAILVQDIRNSKYLSWERLVRDTDFPSGDLKKAGLYLASYVVAVPAGIIAICVIIFFLWLLSFLVG